MPEAQSKKLSHKQGRNKTRCDRYKTQNRREKNKARDLVKHLRTHTNDGTAKTALLALRKASPSFVRGLSVADVLG